VEIAPELMCLVNELGHLLSVGCQCRFYFKLCGTVGRQALLMSHSGALRVMGKR